MGERTSVESDTFLILLGGLLVLAFLAEETFVRLRLPPVLVLIGCGLVLGPGLQLLPAERFSEVAPHFGALAFLLILFEGGLELELQQVLGRWRAGLLLAVVSFTLALVTVALVAVCFGLSVARALVLGIVLAPISGAIVIPLAGKLGLHEEVRTLMVLEAALADVLGVLGVVLAGQLVTGGGFAGLLALGSLLAALFSVLLAVVLGLIWPRVLCRLGDRRFLDVLTFGLALVLYGVVELPGASGALAVLVFGLTLANERRLLHLLRLVDEPTAGVVRQAVQRLHGFIGELTFLVRAFFFVFLGVVVRFARLPIAQYAQAVLILGGFLLARRLALKLLGSGVLRTIDADARRTLLLVQPRGLVSAVLAIEAAHLGLDADGTFLGLASLLILATNILLMVGVRNRRQQASSDTGS
ncbi:MAG TPA: cation:proton antiporter [Thermoanaerobaculaceae bacterium]|nr:cation:proton antiporter [Thermoanaerobaculaceae bacterium]